MDQWRATNAPSAVKPQSTYPRPFATSASNQKTVSLDPQPITNRGQVRASHSDDYSLTKISAPGPPQCWPTGALARSKAWNRDSPRWTMGTFDKTDARGAKVWAAHFHSPFCETTQREISKQQCNQCLRSNGPLGPLRGISRWQRFDHRVRQFHLERQQATLLLLPTYFWNRGHWPSSEQKFDAFGHFPTCTIPRGHSAKFDSRHEWDRLITATRAHQAKLDLELGLVGMLHNNINRESNREALMPLRTLVPATTSEQMREEINQPLAMMGMTVADGQPRSSRVWVNSALPR
ncbi:hypothetical protein N7541_003248 [Penicillium brevicompactum]|uniref:Uncharacterized protein n=1 Tax=Penicillium brevicompactum TaxID=5074 RepID=A0A9W9RP06_PENBR|nr:hypothetical protein N7541_003248 [Penicillium brevicompactum]